MVTNPALHKATTKRDRVLHRRVRMMVLLTRQHGAKKPPKVRTMFECHTIARAISMAIPELKLVHGCFYGIEWLTRKGKKVYRLRGCHHSWLVTPDGAIIDPYPVGFSTVDAVLVVTKGRYKMFGGNFYHEDQKAKFVISRKEIRRKSHILLRMIRRSEKMQ